MSVQKSAPRAISWLQSQDYPYSDTGELVVSKSQYAKGGQYGVEIPVINSLRVLENTIKAINDHNVYVTRFNETHGSHLLTDIELEQMLSMCREEGYGIVVGLGPRPEYDIKGSFYRSQFGLEMGRRNNNLDAIRQCVEESIRLAELGCRGITVYDEGVLWVLSEMRSQGYLPKNMKLKTSTHMMCANPWIGKMFHDAGADSVTTAHDLGLPVIQALRKINPNLILDVPTDVYKSKGGFIRFYELAELIQIASPIMLKMGASAQGHPYDNVADGVSFERVKRVAIGLQLLEKQGMSFTRVNPEDEICCIPEAPGAFRYPTNFENILETV